MKSSVIVKSSHFLKYFIFFPLKQIRSCYFYKYIKRKSFKILQVFGKNLCFFVLHSKRDRPHGLISGNLPAVGRRGATLFGGQTPCGGLIFFAGFRKKAEKNNQCVSDRIFRQENSESEHKNKGHFADFIGDKTLLLFKEQRGFKGYFSFFVIKKRNIPLTLKRKNILFHLFNRNNSQASCIGTKLYLGNKIVSFRTCFGI